MEILVALIKSKRNYEVWPVTGNAKVRWPKT